MNDIRQKTSQLYRLGRFMSKMVMPNIGAFIAWGLIAAIFSEHGWWPNADFGMLTGPMMHYMLPLMIGTTGGRLLGENRGAVVAAIATMGVIAGAKVPMVLGAMIVGPFSGWIIRHFDRWLKDKTPLGFEMLTSNFSAGIVGMVLALVGYKVIGPSVAMITEILESGVYVLSQRRLLFLTSVIIEPGKILFLNNAINHGVLGNLGLREVSSMGKSVFFLLETNPGPGLGILAAVFLNAKRSIKNTVPGAMLIHFFGGIHEMYFPYVLANPLLFISAILGGMSGVFVMNFTEVGLVATPSPGSIFAVLAMTPRGDHLSVLAAISISAVVAFLSAHFIMMRRKGEDTEEMLSLELPLSQWDESLSTGPVRKIIFACDTGMGSSAMGAAMVGKMLEDAGIDLDVENAPVDDLPLDADVVITIEALKSRAQKAAPNALCYGVEDFLHKPQYDKLIDLLSHNLQTEKGTKTMKTPESILLKENICLGLPSVSKNEAIRHAGQLLLEGGYVEASYIEGMLARDEKFTTYIGNGVAIPHGENEVKSAIIASGLVVLQYPEGVDFGEGNLAHLVIGIAGKGNEHLKLLSNIAEAIEEEALLAQMITAQSPDVIYSIMSQEE